MTLFQITFVWPNDDWTWADVEAKDFHQAMLFALDKCPATCRVKSIERYFSIAKAREETSAR